MGLFFFYAFIFFERGKSGGELCVSLIRRSIAIATTPGVRNTRNAANASRIIAEKDSSPRASSRRNMSRKDEVSSFWRKTAAANSIT
jgi:hypothetical protein